MPALGAAAGAGAGLIAGTAVGADNARHAASDVEADYGRAYYACMHEGWPPGAPMPMTAAGYGDYGDYPPPPPPPGYYAPYRLSLLPLLLRPERAAFGFGFGGGMLGWHRGFHGGWRHR